MYCKYMEYSPFIFTTLLIIAYGLISFGMGALLRTYEVHIDSKNK